MSRIPEYKSSSPVNPLTAPSLVNVVKSKAITMPGDAAYVQKYAMFVVESKIAAGNIFSPLFAVIAPILVMEAKLNLTTIEGDVRVPKKANDCVASHVAAERPFSPEMQETLEMRVRVEAANLTMIPGV